MIVIAQSLNNTPPVPHPKSFTITRLHPPRRSSCRAHLRTQTMSAFSHSPTLSPTSKPSLRTTCRNPPEVQSSLKFGKQMLSVAFAAVRLGVLEILRIFSRTPNLHISKRFARATGVGLGEREMHLRRSRQVPRRVTRGALRSKVARGCARTAKRIHRP